MQENGVIDEIDKKVISLIQGDLPLDRMPFAVMAKKIGITEDEIINRVTDLKKRDILRRFGATLRHQEAGFSSNAMVTWIVPEDRVEDVGKIFARFPQVTHCYQRNPQRDWRYNLYSMVHGSNREECYRIAERMSRSAGIDDYLLLFSEKEFKKTSMEYFQYQYTEIEEQEKGDCP
ncbi:MAG TPA: Lrp/AsnC family transcriptional regulator [Desulfobacteraceae bacterium]|nr:Lrp/AsnC family transcriptional regulator [Desulfobacteraceae bacterium]